jgi:hypothetical protein
MQESIVGRLSVTPSRLTAQWARRLQTSPAGPYLRDLRYWFTLIEAEQFEPTGMVLRKARSLSENSHLTRDE